MEFENILSYLRYEARTQLCIDPFDVNYSPWNRRLMVAIIFHFLQCVRYMVLICIPFNPHLDLLLGFPLGVLGSKRLWPLAMFTASLTCLIHLVICAYHAIFKISLQWQIGRPIRKLIDTEIPLVVRYSNILVSLTVAGTGTAATIIGVSAILMDSTFSDLFAILLYSTVWSYTMSLKICNLLAILCVTSLFLYIMCLTLRAEYVGLRDRFSSKYAIKMLTVVKFNRICTDLGTYERFWKYILALKVWGYFFNVSVAFQLSWHAPIHIIFKLILLFAVFQVCVALSFILLCPASVSCAAHKLHSKFCSMVFESKNCSRDFRFKLTHTIKRFNRPIAFSLWNTNTIDYKDYMDVSIRFAPCLC